MELKKIFITGGAGYVGNILVPKLLNSGYGVKVFDLFIYGTGIFDRLKENTGLEIIKGDIRDRQLLESSIAGSDAVIHLACISNDPSFELDPDLGKSINYDAFVDLVKYSNTAGVIRFIYISSSSVYGLKENEAVEDDRLQPLTDYAKYKAMCEEMLLKEGQNEMEKVILRPATVCGYSPRMRLDLTVNLLTAQAVNNRKITVFGGNQKRAGIHIDDITDYLVKLLEIDGKKLGGRIYNASCENHTVMEIARIISEIIGGVEIEIQPINDNRSYHISSDKIKRELSLMPKKSVSDAVSELKAAFENGIIRDWQDNIYYNVKKMKEISLR